MIAILDNIRSVYNVGSIFRTADGLGIERLILCGVTPKPVDRFKKIRPDFQKTALGAEKNVVWEYETSTEEAIERFKKEGWYILALEQSEGASDISKIRIPKEKIERGALIVGNENEGISQHLLRYADYIVEIPMRGIKESLNVSVAFGIAVYALTNA